MDNRKRRDKRSKLSEEEKEEIRKNDRERKAKKRLEKRSGIPQPSWLEKARGYYQRKKESNKVTVREKRKGLAKEEVEYERISVLLRMRKKRQYITDVGCGYDGQAHLYDKFVAMKKMRLCKKFGYKRDFMTKKAREKD